MGFLEQLGDVVGAISNPADALNKAKDEVTGKLVDQAKELGNDVFKETLDKLGVTALVDWISKAFGVEGVFSFLNLRKASAQPEKEVDDARVWNISGEFETIFKSAIVGGGVQRLINDRKTQGMGVACYNIAENYRWKKYGQNLLTTETDIENKEQKPEMNAVTYIKNNIGSLDEGDVIWVQGTINVNDVNSSDPASKNHWMTVVRKDADGTIYVGDQNGTYPVGNSAFWSKRYFRKLYKAPTKSYVPDEKTA